MLAPNEAYSVSSLAALREVNSLKTNMSKTQAEVVLGSFVAKGWLLKSLCVPTVFLLSTSITIFSDVGDTHFLRARYSNSCLI
jgi:hypothetical protein